MFVSMVATLLRQVVIAMNYSGSRDEALSIARVHRRILDAIEARDVGAAIRRSARHVDATERVMNSQVKAT